jgi:hypothetical protein
MKLLRLARISGHPLDTASINFEPVLSISWITVSLTVADWADAAITVESRYFSNSPLRKRLTETARLN